MDYNNIPEELSKLPRWVCFRLEERDRKLTKIPVNFLTGGQAMSNNPSTWGTFQQAVEAAQKGYVTTRAGSAISVNGIGFMFNGDGLLGVDLDHGRDPETGELQDWAKDIIQELDSYTEVSQSGSGIHIICRGKLPVGKRRQGNVEMYSIGRYFVMTGNVLDDAHTTIENRTEQLAVVHAKYLNIAKTYQKSQKNEQKTPVFNQKCNSSLSVQEIIDKAGSAKNGGKFRQLMGGDVSGYNSPSEADLALCNIIAFYTHEPSVVDAIYRQSKLMREKWDEMRGEDWTYGQITINRAIQDATGAYSPARQSEPHGGNHKSILMKNIEKPSDVFEPEYIGALALEKRNDPLNYAVIKSKLRGTVNLNDLERAIKQNTRSNFEVIRGNDSADTESWKSGLQRDEKGGLSQTIHNCHLILLNDPRLKGCAAYDVFTRRDMLIGVAPWEKDEYNHPWSKVDDAGLRYYLEKNYGLRKKEAISDALDLIMHENSFHPVRDYLDSIHWDGVPRIETLFIDYLGADDTKYHRCATRKWIIAGVARIRDPGCKFDYVLILVGRQGIGKSTTFSKLVRNPVWFSDSLSQIDNSKESMEALSGKWIIELGELSALKRQDIENVKTFLSKQEDSYRPSYGPRLETYPRQCIFAGTSNRDDFLRDATGGRRFWPVVVKDSTRMWSELTPDIVDQIWAEADFLYKSGERLYLEGEAEKAAISTQVNFTELGGKAGVAAEFLERLLPKDWDTKSIADKLTWLYERHDGNQQRESISGIELFVECFGGRISDYTAAKAYEMSDIMMQIPGWKRGEKPRRIKNYGKQRVFIRDIKSDSGAYPWEQQKIF